jgi:hypothetical protein
MSWPARTEPPHIERQVRETMGAVADGIGEHGAFLRRGDAGSGDLAVKEGPRARSRASASRASASRASIGTRTRNRGALAVWGDIARPLYRYRGICQGKADGRELAVGPHVKILPTT